MQQFLASHAEQTARVKIYVQIALLICVFFSLVGYKRESWQTDQISVDPDAEGGR